MAYLRQSFGKYMLDLSEEELNAIKNAMDIIGNFTEVEQGIYYQLTKYRDYLKMEDKWYREQEKELDK